MRLQECVDHTCKGTVLGPLGCLSLTRSLLGLELLIEWIVLPPFRSWLGPVQTLRVCLSRSQ